MTDFINQLFQNKLFLQYLSGAGADIGAGGTGLQAANKITQENIGAQNMAQLFSKMLGGEIPDGGKVTMDKDGMKLNVPSSALGQGGFGGLGIGNPGSYTPDPNAGMKTIYPYGAPTAPPAGNTPAATGGGLLGSLGSLLNPSSGQPNISASDLAGLSTTDVSNALQGALGIEGLKQKKVTDVADMILKLAQAKNLIEPDGLDAQYPIPHYDAGPITNRQWSALPEDERRYSLYSHAMITRNKVPVPKAEWDMLDPTEQTKSLYQLSKRPELKELKIELSEAARNQINIGADTMTREKTKQQAYVTGPEALPDIITTLQKDTRAWRATEQANLVAKERKITIDKARSLLQKAMIRKALDEKIRAAYMNMGEVTFIRGKGWFLDGKLIREDI